MIKKLKEITTIVLVPILMISSILFLTKTFLSSFDKEVNIPIIEYEESLESLSETINNEQNDFFELELNDSMYFDKEMFVSLAVDELISHPDFKYPKNQELYTKELFAEDDEKFYLELIFSDTANYENEKIYYFSIKKFF